MGSYTDGYMTAELPSRTKLISTQDKINFLKKDIDDAKQNIKNFNEHIERSKSGISASIRIIAIATEWIAEYNKTEK